MADLEVQENEEWRRPLDNRFINTYEVSNLGRIRNRCTGTITNPYPSRNGTAMVSGLSYRGKETSIALWKLIAITFIGDIANKLVKYKDKNKMNVAVSNLILVDKCKVDFDVDKEIWRDIEDEEYFGRYAVSNMGRIKTLFRTQRYPVGSILSRLNQDNKTPYVEMRRRDGSIVRHRLVDFVARAFLGDNKGLNIQYHDGNKMNIKADNIYYAGNFINYQQQPIFIGCNKGWRITRLTHRGAGGKYIDYLIDRFQRETEQHDLDLTKVEAFIGKFTDIFRRFVTGSQIKSQLVRYDAGGGETLFAFHVIQNNKVLLKIFPPYENG